MPKTVTSRATFHVNDFAKLLGRGETGWRSVDVLKTVCRADGLWVGPLHRLGAEVSRSRAAVLRTISPKVGNRKERERMEDHIDRYEEQITDVEWFAETLRKRTRRSIKVLVAHGLVTSTTDGHHMTTLTLTEGVVYLTPKSTFSIPVKLMQNTPWKPASEASKKWADCPTSSGRIVPPKWADCPTYIKEDQEYQVSIRLDLSSPSENKGEPGSADLAPPTSPRPRTKQVNPLETNDDPIMQLVRDCPLDAPVERNRVNPLAFLTVEGVPPHPSHQMYGEVKLPPAPLVTEDMTKTQRIELLVTAYRAAVTETYRRELGEDWRPPRTGFWWGLPKPPKPTKRVKDLTKPQVNLLDAARALLKRECPPHVWAMHMCQHWVESTGKLDRAPMVKYIYSPRVIETRGAWGRSKTDEFIPRYTELSPKGFKLASDWRRMRHEFQTQRVDSPERARKIAAAYFPDDTYERRAASAHDEADAMTEMLADQVKAGDWVWPPINSGKTRDQLREEYLRKREGK